MAWPWLGDSCLWVISLPLPQRLLSAGLPSLNPSLLSCRSPTPLCPPWDPEAPSCLLRTPYKPPDPITRAIRPWHTFYLPRRTPYSQDRPEHPPHGSLPAARAGQAPSKKHHRSPLFSELSPAHRAQHPPPAPGIAALRGGDIEPPSLGTGGGRAPAAETAGKAADQALHPLWRSFFGCDSCRAPQHPSAALAGVGQHLLVPSSAPQRK